MRVVEGRQLWKLLRPTTAKLTRCGGVGGWQTRRVGYQLELLPASMHGLMKLQLARQGNRSTQSSRTTSWCRALDTTLFACSRGRRRSQWRSSCVPPPAGGHSSSAASEGTTGAGSILSVDIHGCTAAPVEDEPVNKFVR